MAADVSSLAWMLSGYKEEGKEKRDVVTRDLLGGGTILGSTGEVDLECQVSTEVIGRGMSRDREADDPCDDSSSSRFLSNWSQVVAIKHLNHNKLQGSNEFLVEVLMLIMLHHPNLVSLCGYCAEGDERLLVY